VPGANRVLPSQGYFRRPACLMPNQPDDQLERIQLTGIPPTAPDTNTQFEEIELENARLEVRNKRQNISLRKGFGISIFVLGCLWLAFIGFVIFIEGIGEICGRSFSLPQPVLLALIGTTTVNVLGLFYVVTNYLFPKKPD
jgi:hypothetical protein